MLGNLLELLVMSIVQPKFDKWAERFYARRAQKRLLK